MLQHLLSLLMQLSLLGLASASPITTQTASNPLGYQVGGGVVGFIILVIDIIIWIEVLGSTRPVPNKILWALLVFIFPVVGAIIYFLFSNRQSHKGGYEAIP